MLKRRIARDARHVSWEREHKVALFELLVRECEAAETRYIRIDSLEMCCRVAFEQNIVHICSADMDNKEYVLAENSRLGAMPPVVIATQKVTASANLRNIALVVVNGLGMEMTDTVLDQWLGRANREGVKGGYAVVNASIRRAALLVLPPASKQRMHAVRALQLTREIGAPQALAERLGILEQTTIEAQCVIGRASALAGWLVTAPSETGVNVVVEHSTIASYVGL